MEFNVTRWDEKIGREPLVRIRNLQGKVFNPEGYIEMKESELDHYFGKETSVPSEFLCFREARNNTIVAFAGITRYGGILKTPRVWYGIVPNYLNSPLPQIIINAAITLSKESKTPNVFLTTLGPTYGENAFDKALTSHGYSPFHYIWLMNLTEFDTKSTNDCPEGVNIVVSEELEDHEGFGHVYNEAFKESFEAQVMPTIFYKNFINACAAYFHNKIFLAYAESELVGLNYVRINKKTGTAGIQWLAVLPEYQNRGIGTALLRRSIVHLMKDDVKPIKIGVDGENESAMVLYKRVGFQVQEHMTNKFYKLK